MSEQLTRSELRAVGIVTNLTSRRSYSSLDHRMDVLFYPSVRFQTEDGKTIEVQSKLGSNAPPRVGEEVTVLYDPTRPEEAKVALGSMFRPSPRALAVAGTIFLGMMALFFLFFVTVIVLVTLS